MTATVCSTILDISIHPPGLALAFHKTRPDAVTPLRKSAGAAGFDLSTPDAVTLSPGARVLVKTGIQVAFPESMYLRVAPRSGLALTYGVDVLAGVIDSDYRGEIGVILLNTGSAPVTFAPGDRIAQLIPEMLAPVFAVECATDLDATTRGTGGFGSTGQ